MKFVLLIDSTYSDNSIITHVSNLINRVNDECSNVHLETFILNNGIAVDSDTHLLLNILMNEASRTPVILDKKSASYYPEILKMQPSIVMFKDHSTNDEVNFYESTATSHGARIDYINHEFHDLDNTELSVVNMQKHIATYEYYVSIAKQWFREHNNFPIILLPRNIQSNCKSLDELVEMFEHRAEYEDMINWLTTSVGISFDEYLLNTQQLTDIAIHSLSDKRLETNKSSKNIPNKKDV